MECLMVFKSTSPHGYGHILRSKPKPKEQMDETKAIYDILGQSDYCAAGGLLPLCAFNYHGRLPLQAAAHASMPMQSPMQSPGGHHPSPQGSPAPIGSPTPSPRLGSTPPFAA
eukprot:4980257-Amphidinium_carterae.1